jgi:pilus assembly protein CpaE
MDIGMPLMDGIRATEIMTVELPGTAVIILTCQDEGEYLRKAMASGARDFLTKPPDREEMLRTIRRTYELEQKRRSNQELLSLPQVDKCGDPGRVISVFSAKGGVGGSVIAVNLAVALARLTQKRIAVIDLNLQLGDVALLFDLTPRRTISDLVGEGNCQDPRLIEAYMMDHSGGVRVLPAPLRPEYAEIVRAEHVEQIINNLKTKYDYIIIDTHHLFDDLTLAALDCSDFIVMVTVLDILTVKNVKLALEVFRTLNYGPQKIKVIVNHVFTQNNISIKDLEAHLIIPIVHSIPNDGKLVINSCNQGIPFLISHPRAPISKAILGLGRELTEMG